MNASVEWLNAFLDAPRSALELRDLLTAHTATVEEVVRLRTDLAPIVVARVVEERAHPDSDHLHLTKVDMGTGELLDVVCGAPNVRAGALYPFAPTGTLMPGGLKIEKRKIRGQTSNGMLCSARELGLGQEHEGILELSVDAAPGTPLLEALSVGDTRLVVDVLPNRPDLLSHLGLAREIAALTGSSLELPELALGDIAIPAPKRFRRAGNAGGIVLHLEDATLATRYMGIVVRGLRVGPSPQWLVDRLAAVGSRSINNVVDATNYVLHELGQPTHAFDLAKFDLETTLPQKTVVVRSARDGETLVTLDGVERMLTSEMTVIADSVRPVGLAGVMGGRDTEVDADTTDIFIECANFVPARTRRTRRVAGLSTDASYRFERGVDVTLAPRALERVAALVIALAGGRVDNAPVDLYAGDPMPTPLVLRTARLHHVLGVPLPAERAAELLRAVGCVADVEDGGTAVRCVPPTWRLDLVAEIDLVEEIARLHGYERLPDEIRPYRPGSTTDAPLWTTAARLRDALVGAGFLEARPIPFVAGGEAHVRVVNPLAESEAHLRRTLLESLERRAEYNLAHMQGDVRLFEIGSAFAPGDMLPDESVRVALLVMGGREPVHFAGPPAQRFDEWDAKALAGLVGRTAFPGAAIELVPAPDANGRLWRIAVGGKECGEVRRLSLDAPVWASPAFGVELVLGVMSNGDVAPPGEHAHDGLASAGDQRRPSAEGSRPLYRPLPSTPAAEFDLALLVPSGVTANQVEEVIRRAGGDLLERVALFDLYEGAGVEGGHRSVAWRLTLRHPERTLRDREIEGRRARILGVLEQELNVRQRTS
ncbi:MAG TPA: phenylalanine--tRNA ligase subunit beta [Gemmatimonadaceae bacterium]|nr:phenylalanine--tRNA ligase subunit beta [Gemmatimonadaceae bacterium]